jgi:hypothetical protein
MEIKGKVHCFFEQSGTFKNEFIKLGIPAEDYDIQNNFGETDHVVDLFAEIENGYEGKPSLFDNITKDDLIIAFFPCIYFSALSQMAMFWTCVNYRKKTMKEKTDMIIERSHNRETFFRLAVKMLATAEMRGLRIIMENPWSEQTFLKANFVMTPTYVDMDRTKRGDYFKKPTAYFFINCKPTKGFTLQQCRERKNILNAKPSGQAGLCSEDRSMISKDYARNWICDLVLGIKQPDVDQDWGEPLF